MTEDRILDWVSDLHLRVDDTDYDLFQSDDGNVTRLRMLKTRAMVEGYLEHVVEFQGANMCELGICQGGSTAFFAQLLNPRRLVAFERTEERTAVLDTFLGAHSLSDSVRLHYGVDQADRDRLTAILDAELDGEALDFVIDDASHLYGPTRATFEVVFPRVRPGGLYVIEDWRPQPGFIALFIESVGDRTSTRWVAIETALTSSLADLTNDNGQLFIDWCARTITDPEAPGHAAVAGWYADLRAHPTAPISELVISRVQPIIDAAEGEADRTVVASLTTLAGELLLGVANGHPCLGDLTITPYWIAVRRGDAEARVGSFSIDDLAVDHLRTLTPRRPSM